MATLVWAADMGMGAEPGTMGLGLAGFVLIWTLMMAAMMLPAIAPLVTLYSRTVCDHRRARLGAFGSGYVLAWALTGFVAFGLASLFATLADDRPTFAQAVAVGAFAGLRALPVDADEALVPAALPQPDRPPPQVRQLQGADAATCAPVSTTAFCASGVAGC